jgi:hypothetical protein
MRSAESIALEAPALILFQDRFYFQQEVGLEEDLVGAVVGPGADEAGGLAVDGYVLRVTERSGTGASRR